VSDPLEITRAFAQAIGELLFAADEREAEVS